MKIKAPKDFWAGLMFMAFGIGFLLIARNYAMGTAVRMGPAYFPTMLGGLLALIGLVIFVQSFALDGERIPRIRLRPMFFILLAIILFGILLRPIGLILATAIVVFVGAFGGHDFKLRDVTFLYIGLAIFAVVVFVKGLGLPIPVCPSVLDDACRRIGIGN